MMHATPMPAAGLDLVRLHELVKDSKKLDEVIARIDEKTAESKAAEKTARSQIRKLRALEKDLEERERAVTSNEADIKTRRGSLDTDIAAFNDEVAREAAMRGEADGGLAARKQALDDRDKEQKNLARRLKTRETNVAEREGAADMRDDEQNRRQQELDDRWDDYETRIERTKDIWSGT